MHIIEDVWLYIKTFLFHNIKTQGKHLKNDLNIRNYNKIINIFNNILKETSNPRIILGIQKNNFRIVKFIYELNYKNIRSIILIHQIYNGKPPYKDVKQDYASNIRKLN